jgi:hypothetical protein
MALTASDISTKLYLTDTFSHGERRIRVLFLLPEPTWRPLKVDWWHGKEAAIIGGDEQGNYLLRHCDGSVRLWDHARGHEEIIAGSVSAFLAGLTRSTQE